MAIQTTSSNAATNSGDEATISAELGSVIIERTAGTKYEENRRTELISNLRASSRLLVREFGFMSTTFADTDLSLSAVHALIEIWSAGGDTNVGDGISAAELSTLLNLEKSSVSRLLKKLIADGEIEEHDNAKDRRMKGLALTSKGRETIKMINEFGNTQVEKALERLGGGVTADLVWKGIEAYGNALRSVRLGQERLGVEIVKIAEGYQPGLAGRVIEMHMNFYTQAADFGAVFEARITTRLGDVIPRLDGSRAQVWTAMVGEKILGSLFIDTESKYLGSGGNGLGTAHFSLFLIDESLRGKGVGKMLIDRAMKWVDDRGLECQLWTFRGLLHARKLYDRAGFALVEEGSSERLGKEVWVQRFVRPRKAVPSEAAGNFAFQSETGERHK